MARVIRALIVTNMWPTEDRPAHGSFVADQVTALRATGEVELETFAFEAAGDPRAYVRAARRLRRTHGADRFDVVHAHFGLSAWPALAARARLHAVTLHGTDVVHPRSRALTLGALPLQGLVAAVSAPLAARVPRWATRGRAPALLATGVDLRRFRRMDRREARERLGLAPDERCLLFGADPSRPEKRADRARELASAAGARLLTLGGAPPDEMPTWINAADAVLVTSDRESFGLLALEALACEVPVLSTPVGVAPLVLDGLPGTLCAPFDRARWLAALRTAPSRLDAGRERVAPYGADACAARVVQAWRGALDSD